MSPFFRATLAALLGPLIALILGALATFETLPFWGNAVTQGVAFVVAGILTARIAGPRFAAVAASLGFGLSWGLIALVTFFASSGSTKPLRSIYAMFVFVALAITAAYLTSRTAVGSHPRERDSDQT